MIDQPKIIKIEERDIDLLLLEEFNVNLEFCRWFAGLCWLKKHNKSLGTWHSVADTALGESDLIHLFEDAQGQKQALMIENKIDAPQQPRQAERYCERGEQGIKEGNWQVFTTCIIAPAKYLESKDLSAYQYQISYEALEAWFSSQTGTYSKYRAKVISQAVDQAKKGYQRVAHPEMSAFGLGYEKIYQEQGKNLHLKKLTDRPATNSWFEFAMPHLPTKCYIVHQVDMGFVKLMLLGRGDQFSEIAQYFAGELPIGITVMKAGKSVAIACEVETINPLKETAESQKETILDALNKVVLLEGIAQQHHSILDL
ncbi:MAG: hypothetical protein QNL04_08515 [SAR324 cluster bacterium]|nr:hypothetical protein [SAR324 cluster bacterium]